MKRRAWTVLALATVALLGAKGCSCGKKSKTPNLTCPDAKPGPYDGQLFDESTFGESQEVFVKTIEDESELIGGPYAQGKVGDLLVYNDQVRFIIEAVDSITPTIGQFGGNIIDADIARAPGEDGQDHFGELIPVLELGKTMLPDTVEIVRDGSDGGPVEVKVCGDDATIDFFNLKALAGGFGITLAFDPLADKDIRVSNTYVLAPGSNEVHVATTVANSSGEAYYSPFGDVVHTGTTQETFINNQLGWGEGGLDAALGANPPTHYQVWASPEVTYGLIPPEEPAIALDVSGINALVYGFENAFAIFSSTPEPDSPGVVKVPNKKTRSYHRTLVIGDGPGAEPVTDAYFALQKIPDTVARAGKVTEDDGTTPIEGARVTLLDSDRYPVVSFTSDSDGNYGGMVPAGDYTVVADVVGRDQPTFTGGSSTTINSRYGEHDLAATEITLDAASADLPDVTFPAAATLEVTVTDITTGGVGNGTPMPAKVVVTGTDPTPEDSLFRDPRKDHLPADIIRYAHADATGTVSIPIEPGTFDVFISRGPEYSAFTTQVTVNAGDTIPVSAELDRVVDSDGWIAMDSHIHMQNSPDSRVLIDRRVISAAVEGVEVLVTTDHDFVTDVSPYVATLNLDPFVGGVIGEEITSWDYGHFNSYPRTQDADARAGGAFDWMGGLGPVNNLTVEEIFTGVDAADSGTNVKQINHPRAGSEFQSYFDAIGLDTLTLQSKTDPAEKRIPDPAGSSADDTKLFFDGFDAMEVINGTGQSLDADRTNALINDWFTFLSHGLPIVGVGVSDTHNQYQDQVGWARSWVNVGAGNDDPSNIDSEALATAVVDGKVVFGQGGFMSVTIDDGGAGLAGPGELLPNAGAAANLNVTASMPLWIEVDTLRVYANTPDTVAPFDAQNTTAPAFVCEQAVAPAMVANGNGTNYYELNTTVDLNAGACDIGADDAWVVVELAGSSNAATLYPYVHEFALRADMWANAVYVDRDDDGAYTESGPIVTSAYVPPAPRKHPALDADWLKRLDGDMSPSELEDVRAVFHSLSCKSTGSD